MIIIISVQFPPFKSQGPHFSKSQKKTGTHLLTRKKTPLLCFHGHFPCQCSLHLITQLSPLFILRFLSPLPLESAIVEKVKVKEERECPVVLNYGVLIWQFSWYGCLDPAMVKTHMCFMIGEFRMLLPPLLELNSRFWVCLFLQFYGYFVDFMSLIVWFMFLGMSVGVELYCFQFFLGFKVSQWAVK